MMLQSAHNLRVPQKRPNRETPRKSSHRAGITGRRILVTGAGGSIGSELTRQIAACQPSHLTLLDNCEVNLYEVDGLLAAREQRLRWTPCLGDVRHPESLRHVLVKERPDIVFHAAALKHVPLLETDHNVIEAVRTNVIGTKNVADLCAARGIDFVMISTDKAVKPSSTMGLTKRVAEIYVHQIALRHPEIKLAQVRFGNVLGSSGSVVPLFKRQIERGGPLTLTHPDMTRFLMSIQDAVELTLAASCLPHQGYALYVLEMGAPVRILDLAKHMIEAAGLRPYIDIPIQVIGPRPGEKLHEELTYSWEELHETTIPGVRVAFPVYNPLHVARQLEELVLAEAARNVHRVKRALARIVPEFQPAPSILGAGLPQESCALEVGALEPFGELARLSEMRV